MTEKSNSIGIKYLTSTTVLNENMRELQAIISKDIKELRKNKTSLKKTALYQLYAKLRCYMVFGLRSTESVTGSVVDTRSMKYFTAVANINNACAFHASILPAIKAAGMQAVFSNLVYTINTHGETLKESHQTMDPKDHDGLVAYLEVLRNYAASLLVTHQLIKVTI